MVQHRPTPGAADRSVERRCREGSEVRGVLPEVQRAEAPSTPVSAGSTGGEVQGGGAQGIPAPASRRCLIGGRRGAVCPQCARRALTDSSMPGVSRRPCQFLAVTWVVLTVGEPQPTSP